MDTWTDSRPGLLSGLREVDLITQHYHHHHHHLITMFIVTEDTADQLGTTYSHERCAV